MPSASEPQSTSLGEVPAAGPEDPFQRAEHALDAVGVRWCRLRDRSGGQEEDLLISPADLDAARDVLASVGFHERHHLGHGSHRTWFAYDEIQKTWAKLDIVTSIDLGRFQEWRTAFGADCLARRELGPDAFVPAPDDAFWTLLFHELLDHPEARLRRLEQLRDLAAMASTEGDGAAIAADVLPLGWTPERAIEVVRAGDPKALAALGRELGRGFTRREPLRTWLRRIGARVLRRIDRHDPPFVRRGLTVALLGPDGAGKSLLAATVGVGAPFPTRAVYLGLYGAARAAGGDGSGVRRSATRRIPGVGTTRRLLAMWRGWLIGWAHVRRGRLVIFDRYPYDARLADATHPIGRLRRAILGRALPAPDVVIVLDAPAEVLVARKPEHPIGRIESQRRRYLELAPRLDGAIVVDVRDSIEVVAHRVTAIASATLAERRRAR